MKMSLSPEGGLQFRVFREKVQQIKYIIMGITYTRDPTHDPIRSLKPPCKNHLFAKTLFLF